MASLNPRVTISGEAYVATIHLMAAISVSELGDMVGDLSNQREKIVAAMDFVFQGF